MDKYNPPDDFLPESYTCFFLLKMPRYSCKRVLREKLKYAIHFCKSIGKFQCIVTYDDAAHVAFIAEMYILHVLFMSHTWPNNAWSCFLIPSFLFADTDDYARVALPVGGSGDDTGGHGSHHGGNGGGDSSDVESVVEDEEQHVDVMSIGFADLI
jgi:hypothetical protein